MNQEIELLVFKAYHGELSEAERDALTQWVNASPAHARQVVEYLADDHSIEIALQRRQVANPVSASEMVQVEVGTKRSALDNSALINIPRTVAALLVIATLVGVALWLGGSQQVDENHEVASLGVTTPVVFSDVQVMESTDLKWNRYTSRGEDSEAIVIPESGFLYHEFRGGGFILLEGPTTYQLEDNFTIRLVEGRLVARADTHEPFTILVDGNRIKVEGAEFGVQSNDDGDASAIVFKGVVEVTPDQSEGRSPVISVKAGQIVSLRPDTDQVDQLARATQTDSSEYERLIDSVKLRPSHMSNSVQFLADAPESLLASDLADRKYVRMFCERAGVSVKVDELPNIQNRLTDLGEVPAGLLLDSYMLHFDPQIDRSRVGVPTTGMVIFDRPIHAVLGSGLSIRSTDALFGNANTVYPRTPRSASGLEDAAEWGIEYDKDCIKLETDGKTLLFRVQANQELDQIRILVEARKPTQLSD